MANRGPGIKGRARYARSTSAPRTGFHAGMDENDLIARARVGDRAAFGELVRRHRDAVYRFATRWVSDPDYALDIAQETFVRAFKGLEGYRGDARLRTWLFSIALNVARSSARRRGRSLLAGAGDAAGETAGRRRPQDLRGSELQGDRGRDRLFGGSCAGELPPRRTEVAGGLAMTGPGDCDRVSELLPEYLAGRLTDEGTARVRVHLEDCAECADRARAVGLLQETPVPVPDPRRWGRFVEGVVEAAERRHRRRRLRRWIPVLAVAALVAAALWLWRLLR